MYSVNVWGLSHLQPPTSEDSGAYLYYVGVILWSLLKHADFKMLTSFIELEWFWLMSMLTSFHLKRWRNQTDASELLHIYNSITYIHFVNDLRHLHIRTCLTPTDMIGSLGKLHQLLKGHVIRKPAYQTKAWPENPYDLQWRKCKQTGNHCSSFYFPTNAKMKIHKQNEPIWTIIVGIASWGPYFKWPNLDLPKVVAGKRFKMVSRRLSMVFL